VALPALTPDREPLLEYDLVRAIARAVSTAKPVIGVMSALPVFGMPPSQFTGGQPVGTPGHHRRAAGATTPSRRVSLDAERIDGRISRCCW